MQKGIEAFILLINLLLLNESKIPVTPRGGSTGLCGACIPVPGGIVLSLENMNRVIEIDSDNRMAVAEPGVRLMDFYQADAVGENVVEKMRLIKKAFDPNNILNPGKIF